MVLRARNSGAGGGVMPVDREAIDGLEPADGLLAGVGQGTGAERTKDAECLRLVIVGGEKASAERLESWRR